MIKKKLRVQLYWLPRSCLSNVDVLRVPTIPDIEDGAIHGVGLWDVTTDQRIRSGDMLDINTDDPEKLPLPDLKLLDMQWVLNRISALSGAAEPQDYSYHNGEYEDDCSDDFALDNESWSTDSDSESLPPSSLVSPHKAAVPSATHFSTPPSPSLAPVDKSLPLQEQFQLVNSLLQETLHPGKSGAFR